MPFRVEVIAVVVGIALAAGAVLAWNWHGKSQHRAGYAQAQADALIKQAEIERGMQYERDRADAIHRGNVMATQVAQRDLVSVRAELDRLREQSRHRVTQIAGAVSRSDGPDSDWIAGFGACYGEYADLAADAAVWADRVNGLQGYVRAIGAAR